MHRAYIGAFVRSIRIRFNRNPQIHGSQSTQFQSIQLLLLLLLKRQGSRWPAATATAAAATAAATAAAATAAATAAAAAAAAVLLLPRHGRLVMMAIPADQHLRRVTGNHGTKNALLLKLLNRPDGTCQGARAVQANADADQSANT